MQWHKKNPKLLKIIVESLREHYPDLWLDIDKQSVRVRGSFPVTANNKIIDRFKVLIEFRSNYPKSLPRVFEVGGRIPHLRDRHINEIDVPAYCTKKGSVCLFIAEEASKYHPEGISFVDFLKGPVNDFFLWQIEYELTGKASVKGRDHGAGGTIEYYKERIGTDDLDQIIRFVDYIARDAKGHWPCYCGSGQRMKCCHYTKILNCKKEVSRNLAKASRWSLLEYQKSGNLIKRSFGIGSLPGDVIKGPILEK